MNRASARTLLSTLILLFAVASAWAQAGPPKPGPEVKKLDYFIGAWTSEATILPGPWGQGGKFISSETFEWMNGGFFVVGHSDYKLPAELGGDGKETSMMGYDTAQSAYTADGFNSQGQHQVSKGSLAGDTWTWTSSANYGGQDIKQRFSMKVLSPTSYTYKFESSVDGTNWMTFMEGKATKK